jgi:hypothetical protein
MGIISPETNAIPNLLWIDAQEGIQKVLQAISDTQATINQDYAFKVYSNKYSLSDGDFGDLRSMVNIRIGKMDSKDVTNFSMTHSVTYFIDCYVRGQNEDNPDVAGDMVPADEVAVQRLYYLIAMTYYGMTSLKNFYMKMTMGKIVPSKNIGILFNPVKDAENSAEPYAPAQITFVADFPYDAEDLSGLPAYQSTFIDLKSWAARIIK